MQNVTFKAAMDCIYFIRERSPIFDRDPHSRRTAEMRYNLASGDLQAVAKVFCDLTHRQASAALSGTERRLLKDACEILTTSISAAVKRPAGQVRGALAGCAIGDDDFNAISALGL